MEFKNRRPQNENRVFIMPEEGSPFYATVERSDNPESGNEGTPIEAGIFEEFNQKVEKSVQDSSAALTNSTNAVKVIDNLSVSCTEADCTATPQVEISTNAENNHKNIHFILPAAKQGKSYRNKGAWNDIELYVNNELYIDTISFNGCTFYCKVTNTNQQPEDGTENEYWGLLAIRGSNANVTIVDNLESDSASYALSARQGSVINSKIDGVVANIAQVKGTLEQNITQLDESLQQNLSQVESELNGKISINSANITKNCDDINNNTLAIAQHTNSLQNLTSQVSNILNKVYPVGAIYISRSPTSPAQLFGGDWNSLGEGKTIWTTTWTTTTTQRLTGSDSLEAALPNIVGGISYNTQTYGTTGAFTHFGSMNTPGGSSYKSTQNGITFDASISSPIYRNDCNTVQPPAYKVYMWERIN